MRIEYSVSLWNYGHLVDVQSLECEITLIRELGYGVELWGNWRGERDLFEEAERARLKILLQGMTVSVHTALGNTFEQHKKQIDSAAAWGARVVVVHSSDLTSGVDGDLDVSLARNVVAYAADRGVRIALENGQLPFLVRAIEAVDELGICLDVGHVYLTQDSMRRFLDALQDRIIHLHLQDVLTEAEAGLPHTRADHYIPGTGGIPSADWALFAERLQDIDFHGTAVFEIGPRNPRQTALLGARFVSRLFEEGEERRSGPPKNNG